MRITPFEKAEIKRIVSQFFPDGVVYLFGSRSNDHKKGGDIDLLISSKESVTPSLLIDLKLKLKDSIGDQKIDILVTTDPLTDGRAIVGIAFKTGIEL